MLYHFQKRCLVKAIRYENRVELFVLNGNKRPIQYEFHNGMKPNQYNGNMVLAATLKTLKCCMSLIYQHLVILTNWYLELYE